MVRTPHAIAEHLVKMYGTSTTGITIAKEEFEKQSGRERVDHRLIRSVDLALRPMGYTLIDLLTEKSAVGMMSIHAIMEGWEPYHPGALERAEEA
jgi:hypothetical protein